MRRLMVVLFVVLSAACGSDLSAAPQIEYGRDLCDQCGMIISEAAFASSLRTSEGAELKFDEVGGMLVMAAAMEVFDTATFWANDYATGTPVPVADAVFVRGGDITSPMDFRIVAFGDAKGAESFIAAHGGVQHSWAQLTEMALAGSIGGRQSNHEHDGHG